MLQETITLIPAIAGLVAAAGGFWAARAAHRSAVAAQEAARHAEIVDRRGLLRDLTTSAHRVVAESLQIGSLVEELKTEYRMLHTSAGQSGSSREKLLIQRAEAKQKEVYPLQEEARKLIEQRAQLRNTSEEDLTQSLSKFDGYLVQVLRIKDSLEREVIATARDNRIHRERHIKAIQQHRYDNRDAKPRYSARSSCLSLRLTVAGSARKASPTQTGVEHAVNLSNQRAGCGSALQRASPHHGFRAMHAG